KHKDLCYGVLKHGTLFVYESDKMLECKMIIPVHDFSVSIYPEDKRDPELFNKSTAIRLHQDFYLYCGRAIDKEDWYFALISASNFMADSPTLNSKQFDMDAMQNLIRNIHHDPSSRQMQWMNAILGRVFLGMYKTDKVHKFFEQKITKKVSKMKRPMFIDAIAVHRVQVGHAIPYLNNPKLLSLSLDGSLTAEAQVDYEGGLCVEIETGFLWSYSSRMKPIRVNLILSVTLKKLSGRFMFKIKAPPTNRYWIGFYEPPVMDLVIKPIVSDKQIKLQVVTNAIESKIREVIAETMVLPNMDDFVFCDSDGKGGMFDDGVLSP
ncbi:putative integral membrane protein conserved region-domain-containing protein, partial [Zychaea mexicana]|uniref:putative integral membrane protein conserved region-domain-containing protein n=1 Tax=Zychaea mexicana TaxID=64656 RepID=UPI0022FF3238